MAITQIQLDFAGQANVNPRLGRIISTDDLATITTAGYLNTNAAGYAFNPTDMLSIAYNGGEGWFTLSFGANNVITMAQSGGGSFPVNVPNGGTGETSLAAYELIAGGTTDTGAVQSIPSVSAGYVLTDNGPGALPTYQASGGGGGAVLLDPDVGVNQTILNGFLRVEHGLQAGIPSTATAGTLNLFNGHASAAIEYLAVSNSGNFSVRVQNASYGQSTTLTIPDPGINASDFILSDNLLGQTINTGSFTVAQDQIITGSPGNPGELVIEDGTANFLAIACTGALANQVNFQPTGTFGQVTSFLLSDPGASNAYITGLQSQGSTTDNVVTFSNSNGLMKDSGISASSLATNFNYINTYWVSQANGNDANSGTSINAPFQTVQKAITSAGSFSSIIYVVDGVFNNETISTTLGANCNIVINAPSTTFNGSFLFQNINDLYVINAYTVNNLTDQSLVANYLNVVTANNIIDYSGMTITATGAIFSYSFLGSNGPNVYLSAPVMNVTFAPTVLVNAFLTADNIQSFNSTAGSSTSTYYLYAQECYGLNQAGAYVFYGNVTAFSTGTVSGGLFIGLFQHGFYNGTGQGFYMGSNPSNWNYSLSTASPSASGQALISSGAGPNATTAWVGALLTDPGTNQEILTGQLQLDNGTMSLGGYGKNFGVLQIGDETSPHFFTVQLQNTIGSSIFLQPDTTKLWNTTTTFFLPDSGLGGISKFLIDQGVNQMNTGSELLLDKGTGTEAANAVTINAQCCIITTSDLSGVAAGTDYVITLTNSEITVDNGINLTMIGGTNTTRGIQLIAVPGAGIATITISNINALANLNGTLILSFSLI